MLDLPYAEDSTAETDMNVVMTGRGLFVEVRDRRKRTPPFSRDSSTRCSAWPKAASVASTPFSAKYLAEAPLTHRSLSR